jgi:hypothetical protein
MNITNIPDEMFSNKCNFSLIKNIKVVKKESASDTVQMFGKIDNIGVFIKLSFVLGPYDNGLDVETCIYKNIIKTLLLTKKTPHLINYINTQECNNINELNMDQKNKAILISEIDKMNFDFIKYNEPLINYEKNKKQILITEKTEGMKLYEFIDEITTQPEDILSIMLQIIYTLNIFNNIYLHHNDLHLGNIFIEELSQETEIYYATEPIENNPKQFIRLKTKYVAKIYDFDRSSVYYNQSIPRNFKLDFYACRKNNECNAHNPKNDIYKFLVTLNTYISRNRLSIIKYRLIKSKILNLICKEVLPIHYKPLDNKSIPKYDEIKTPKESLDILVKLRSNRDRLYTNIIKYSFVDNVPTKYENNTYYPSAPVKPKLWKPFTSNSIDLTTIYNYIDTPISEDIDNMDIDYMDIDYMDIDYMTTPIPTPKPKHIPKPPTGITNDLLKKQLDTFKLVQKNFETFEMNKTHIIRIWMRELDLLKINLSSFKNDFYFDFNFDENVKKISDYFFINNQQYVKYMLDKKFLLSFFYLGCPIFYRYPLVLRQEIIKLNKIEKEIDIIWNGLGNTIPITMPQL